MVHSMHNKPSYKKFSRFFPVFLTCSAILLSCSKSEVKVYHIGVLCGLDFFNTAIDGFKDKMSELGYLEGKNIFYDIQKPDGETNGYQNIAKRFIKNKVDLIFVFPTEASIEIKKLTQNTKIPVVFAIAFTENTGLINTIREPGGNITGVRWDGPDIAVQRLEILRCLVPGAKHIWVPYLKNYPIVRCQIEALQKECDKENLQLTEITAENADNLAKVLQEKIASQPLPDALLVISEPLCVIPDAFETAARFASKHNIPFGGVYMSVNGYESVFGLTPLNKPQGKQAAFLADKILRGTPAGTIPVVTTESHLIINYRVAKKIGLTINDGLLGRADEIIR